MKKRILCKIVLGLLITAPFLAYSQNVSFNSTSNPPNSSVVLDMSSCTNGGFMLPWMTVAQMNTLSATAITSLLVLDDSSNCYYAYFAGGIPKWVKCYCLCNGGPAQPGAISSTTTTPATGANETFSVTAVAGATSYTWTLPTGATIVTGNTTNAITATMGCSSGNVSVTANNSCGISTARTLAITGSGTAPATPGAISGATDICSGSVTTYSVTAVAGAASYTWTVPAGSTITAGSTTNAIVVTMGSTAGNVTVTATDACGTSAASTLAVTTPTSAPATPTVSGTTPITKSTAGNTFTATAAGATSFTWTVPAAVGTITAGQGTGTITVTAAAGAGSGTITATATNACGTSAAGTELVTVSACSNGAISLDVKNKSGEDVTNFTLTTTGTNELVVIACEGYSTASNPVAFTGSVAITGAWTGAATYYDDVTNKDAEVAIYWFVAPTVGTYTITTTETGYSEYDNFGAALTGFTCTPSVADFKHKASSTISCVNTCSSLLATVTEDANSYDIGAYTDWWETSPTPAFPNAGALTVFNSNSTNTYHDDYLYGGKAIAAAGSNTYTAGEGGGNTIGYAVFYLLNIQ